MEAFGLLVYGFSVLLTWKILALMMVGVVLHRLARGGAADHVPRARHRLLRIEVRAAGILRGLSPHLLFLRRSGARGETQDRHLHGAGAPAHGRRHGHGLRTAAHDVRLERSPARH